MEDAGLRTRILHCFLLLAAAACGGPATGDDPPSLRIASDATFPPFHYLDDEGTPTGLDLALAEEAARRAGYAAEVVVRPYDVLFAELLEGRHDLVAATTGVTPEREARYLFTRPYFSTAQVVIVRTGPGEPGTLGDLEGRRVGAAGEGTSAAALGTLADVERVVLGKGQAGVPALEGGEIDALIVDEFDAVAAARASEGRLRVLREPVAREDYAFVLTPGRASLKAELDAALDTMEQEGRFAEIRSAFGVERDADWPVALEP